MKWIKIEKARVTFQTVYLVKDASGFAVAELTETKQTIDGLRHTFTSTEGDLTLVTHIAIITDPTKG